MLNLGRRWQMTAVFNIERHERLVISHCTSNFSGG
jgi:hypothetical protein